MSKYTITPWRSQADLLQVRQQLYRLDQTGPDLRRHAVDRVMAWKLRGNLPHAVESTALLVDAVYHHHHHEDHRHTDVTPRTTDNSSFSVRAVYSAAFARFVTGFCDIGRSKERSLEPSSMLEIARQIEMPAEFVALRHEATHEELPALRRLVHATEEALRWLWIAYWSRLGEAETRPDGEAAEAAVRRASAEARLTLRNFRSARREAIRAGKHRRSEHIDLVGTTAKTCVELCGNNVEKIEAFVGVLVDDKLLSPSKRKLGSSLEGAYLIWDDLLHRVCREQRCMSSVLVQCLLLTVSTGPALQWGQDVESEAYCSWLTHIADDDAWRSTMSPVERDRLRVDMMRWCCLHPSHWTQFLGSQLIETGEPKFTSDWQEIFEASRLRIPDGERSEGAASDVDIAEAGKMHAWPGKEILNETFDEQADEDGFCDWTRAAVPLHAPIGVTR